MASKKKAAKKQPMFRSIADVRRIADHDIQQALKEIEVDELVLALKGTSDAVRDRFFVNMSQRAAQMIQDDMNALGPTRKADVRRARARIVEILNAVCGPKASRATPKPASTSPKKPSRGPAIEKVRKKAAGFDLRTTPVEEIIRFMHDLAVIARRDGILALEHCCEGMDEYSMMGVQLAVDGTDPRLIHEILALRKDALLAEAARRMKVIRMAVLGLSRGDNPRIIELKCNSCQTAVENDEKGGRS